MDKKINIKVETRELEDQLSKIKSMFDRIGVNVDPSKLSGSSADYEHLKRQLRDAQITQRETVRNLKQDRESHAKDYERAKAAGNIGRDEEKRFRYAQGEFTDEIHQQEELKSHFSKLTDAIQDASKTEREIERNRKSEESQGRGRSFNSLMTAYGIREALGHSANAIGPTANQVLNVGTSALATGSITAGAAVAAAGLYGMKLNAELERDKYERMISRSGNLGNYYDDQRMGRMESVGISRTDFLKQLYSIRQISGQGEGSEDRAEMTAIVQKALDISEQNTNTINSLSRFGAGSTDEIVLKTISALGNKGIKGLDLSKMDLTAANKYLEKILAINTDQYERLGEVNSNAAITALSAFTNLGGVFKGEGMSSKAAMGVSEAFRNPSNILSEYYNYQAILKSRPDLAGNPLGLKIASEDILNDPKAITNRMKQITSNYNLSDPYQRYLAVNNLQQSIFQGMATKPVAEALSKFERDPNVLLRNTEGELPKEISDLLGRAKTMTGPFESVEAKLENTFSKLDVAMNSLDAVVKLATGDLVGFSAAIKATGADLTTIADKVGEKRDSGMESIFNVFGYDLKKDNPLLNGKVSVHRQTIGKMR